MRACGCMAALRATEATAILVTHDQEEALSTADQVAVLSDGAVVQSASPRDLYWHPVDADVAAFVGEANLLTGSVLEGRLRTDLGLLGLVRSASTLVPGAVGATLVRPEQLRLGAHGVPARVVGTEFYGHDVVPDVQAALRIAIGHPTQHHPCDADAAHIHHRPHGERLSRRQAVALIGGIRRAVRLTVIPARACSSSR